MRIIFIHSGKYFFQQLGPHYGPLIKHSLHLLPMYANLKSINLQIQKKKKIQKYKNPTHTHKTTKNTNLQSHDYLRLQTAQEKNKYRSIQSLPTGCIIGIALIDKSYWFSAKDLSSPWSHGPYCYHIRDAFRLPLTLSCRGNMGIWKIDSNTQLKIESMSCVMNKIHEWCQRYNINEKYHIYTALTIMQPFAESIIRKIKNVENRGQKVFKLSENDGVFEGCRLCINGGENDGKTVMDYVQYGKRFKIDPRHKNIPRYMTQSDWKYHASATLTQCQCGRNKKKNLKKKICKENTNKLRRKKKKSTLKPLHEIVNYNKRKKSGHVKKKKLKIYNYYGDGDERKFEEKKKYNLRGDKKKGNSCFETLLNMGYDVEKARLASEKYKIVEDAINYLDKLDEVSKNPQWGYSDSLKLSPKRKRKMDIDIDGMSEKKKKKRRMNMLSDYDEEYEMRKAMKESMVTHNNERKCIDYDSDCYIVEKGWNKNDNYKNKNKKLSSSMVNKIPRRRC